MGSTGSGSFTDYPNKKPTNEEKNNGGTSGIDKCGTAFSANLEEISRCTYYLKYKKVPSTGSEVLVFFNGYRLSIKTTKGEEVGYLPTKFNYLKLCLEDGFSFSGVISDSRMTPTPSISVDIIPV
ncbi:hypothetical protein [Pedobacter cryoconitis]|uniref:hypothetical protein n=1 Tax=Pedobacter cryoconitis TaxID=188932 RepID=UPI00160C4993|nr:hypothetical protein [Pedobacter cryoconitis]MBB5644893.1 hypothetical protein [Pedobacter cryoconitis]